MTNFSSVNVFLLAIVITFGPDRLEEPTSSIATMVIPIATRSIFTVYYVLHNVIFYRFSVSFKTFQVLYCTFFMCLCVYDSQ